MARPIAREAAMQLVFEQLFGGEGEAETLVDLIDYTPADNDRAYIEAVVSGVREHAAELDAEISACLRGWTLQRLSRADLAILRLSVYEMQRAIEFIKSNFQVNLSNALNLRRVSAPLFVEENSGLNDNLNGVERPVSFDIPDE